MVNPASYIYLFWHWYLYENTSRDYVINAKKWYRDESSWPYTIAQPTKMGFLKEEAA